MRRDWRFLAVTVLSCVVAATRWRGRVTSLSSVMGRRSARSLDPTDRFDRDTRDAVISFDGPAPPALVGLRVMVGILR